MCRASSLPISQYTTESAIRVYPPAQLDPIARAMFAGTGNYTRSPPAPVLVPIRKKRTCREYIQISGDFRVPEGRRWLPVVPPLYGSNTFRRSSRLLE